MRTLLYLFISLSFLARAVLLMFCYKMKHHRKDDLYVALGLFILAISYTMYSVSPTTPSLDIFEIICDTLLGFLAVFTTIEAYHKALKERTK